MLNSRLERAFGATLYAVDMPTGRELLRPGECSRTVATTLATGERLVILTAWNPMGKKRAERVNRIAQRRLEARLKRGGFSWWPAVNAPGDAVWEEPSLAVITRRPTEVERLARRFGQAAVLFVERRRPTHVVWLKPARNVGRHRLAQGRPRQDMAVRIPPCCRYSPPSGGVFWG